MLRFPWSPGRDAALLLSREWLATNGLGGYASGTLRGIATRRYHGLFVPDLPAPRGRTMMLPRLDDEIQTNQRRVLLSGVEYEDGRLDGDGHRYLREFRWERQAPIWRFDLDGRRLEKCVVMPYGQNTVYVTYRLLAGDSVRVRLRPFVALRMHDAPLVREGTRPSSVTIAHGRYEVNWSDDAPPMRLALRPSRGVFVSDELISHAVFYRLERERGYDDVEDLFSPGYFTAELTTDASLSLIASTEPWELLEFDAGPILDAERQRIDDLLTRVPARLRHGMAPHLVLAADQFIVFPESRVEERVLTRARGHELRTIIAGYHWFTDWGRDTMISLEGLTLCTGRYDEAKSILLTFSRYVKDGLIPNLFPEGQRSALYHTADATLWYFHALDRYREWTGDRAIIGTLYPVLQSILEHHLNGTHFGIHVDPHDGLLHAGAEGYQLTWMDAKVDDWVVTPRRGKPVEIQALWYNALRLMESWAKDVGESDSLWKDAAERAAASFHRRFWYEAGGHLFDVVDGEGGEDPSLRPNQLFAVSLRFPILHRERWRPVMAAVKEALLTPVGLRSLAPGHRDYKPAYYGDLRARDAAYHQGTVWAWLIGHFADAWVKTHGDRVQAREFLAGFESHLTEAGIGTISEIFDAEPPFHPRGCIAQAWSVAEVLRTLWLTGEDERTS